MDNHNEQKNMKDAVLGKIRSGSLKMHSRYYFALRVAALAAVAFAIFVVTIFICNFLLFSIRINSSDSYLYFGPHGWEAFLRFFPWDFFAADVVLVGILLALLRQFRFGYKSPLLYIILSLIVLTVGAGVALDRATGFNDELLREADEQHLPQPINSFYVNFHRLPPPGQGVCKCVIMNVGQGTLTVFDGRASTSPFTVTLPPNDPRATTSGLEEGDVIFVAGDKDGNTYRIFGIRKLDSGEMK